jgi:hypothetical protein
MHASDDDMRIAARGLCTEDETPGAKSRSTLPA